MIYQPRNVKPSSTSIDIAQDNVFSMEVQTNSKISSGVLYIRDFYNNIVYSTNPISFNPKLYNGDNLEITLPANSSGLSNGNDYKWGIILFQQEHDMLVTYGQIPEDGSAHKVKINPNVNVEAGMIISINGNESTIDSIDKETWEISGSFGSAPEKGDSYKIYSNYILTTPDYIFYARRTPEVSISNVPSSLTLKYHTFQGSYSQTDNVPIVYHKFDLYIVNNDGSKTLVDTTDKVYSANLSYTYNGFRTSNTYAIKMTVENEMGIIKETDFYTFEVVYDIVEYLQQPIASIDRNHNSINVSWVAPVEHDGILISNDPNKTAAPQYLYNVPYNLVNSLYTKGYKVNWESDEGMATMPENFNITLQFSPDKEFFYKNGIYTEQATLLEGETDDGEGNGNFAIKIDKNKLIFEQEPNLTLESYFYVDTIQVSVLEPDNVVQINNDYIWNDSTTTWNDNYYWVEGGTSLERICGHWWKVKITNNSMKIEEMTSINS